MTSPLLERKEQHLPCLLRASRLLLLGRRRTLWLIRLIEFQFKPLPGRQTGRIPTNGSSETLIQSFLVIPCCILFWKSLMWQIGFKKILRKTRQIQLLILISTAMGFRPEPHSTEYSLQLNYSLLPKWMKRHLSLHIFYP